MARILVVDDSDQNLLLIQLYLKDPQFEVVSARSGKEAFEHVARHDFDLVLLDVAMPEMGGFEVCRRLKADPRSASIPVIFLTGRMQDEADKMTGYEIGAVDYITKPVDKQEILARIHVMLRLREGQTRLEAENARLSDLLRRSTRLNEGFRRRIGHARERTRLEDQDAMILVLDRKGVVSSFNEVMAEHCPGIRSGWRPLAHEDPLLASLGELLDGAHPAGRREIQLGEDSFVVVWQRLEDGSYLLELVRSTALRALDRDATDSEEFDLDAEARSVAQSADAGFQITGFVSRSPSVHELVKQVERLRISRSTVLIYGETGCGKELVARSLHFDGPQAKRPFIPIHCGAISPELIESELFGYEKGAFTGATQRKEGLFRAADGGTIFLDEIAETSLDLQVKLLRVLQMGEIRPVGATNAQIVDVRIIAATNMDLWQMVQEGRFREDLYYRLDVVKLYVPPLRERSGDIPILAQHFLRAFNAQYLDRKVEGVTKAAMRALEQYQWPGNVRELENCIDRAFALGAGELLDIDDLPRTVRERDTSRMRSVQRVPSEEPMAQPVAGQGVIVNIRERRRQSDRETILRALEVNGGDKTAAARHLGIARSTFYRRLKELGLG